MKFISILALAAAAKLAEAHSTVHAVLINGVDQGAGRGASGYIRTPFDNSPVKDVQSSAMTCNTQNSAVAKTLKVKAGDTVAFEWHHEKREAGDQIIDPSHKGPVLTYMAPTASNGNGDVWVKLAHEGFSNGKWAVENLRANGGRHSIKVPNVKAGAYLLRPEIIALHEGFNIGGAQFYMACVQVEVTSSGATALPAGVAIPGTYSAEDPGIHVNIYPLQGEYKIPGPAVWNGASSGGGGSTTPPPAATVTKAATPTPTPRPATTLVQVPSPTPSAPAGGNGGGNGGGSVAEWGQCGGANYGGPTACAAGLTCTKFHEYYSQCLKST